ncbi:MAG: AAA family ATPase [Bacteroidota bacterium]
MIRKVIKIKGVGKFENYVPKVATTFPGDFKKIVLLYGINGSGKSTLATIIRSLKGDNSLILKRRTFHLTDSPEIELMIDGISKPFHFSNDKWANNHPDIEIFDNHFINENVFTGFTVDIEHKRKLFDIILGQKGVNLKANIEQIKLDIQEENKALKQCAEDINTKVGYITDAKKFSNLTEVNDIEKRIKEKELEIQICKSFTQIKNTNSLKLIDFSKLQFDFSKLQYVLSKSSTTISEDYLEKVEQHKSHFPIDEETEQWIKKGFENIKDNSCPFCERPFDSTTQIINAYTQYFNSEYLQLQKDINDLSNLFNSLNLPLVLSEIELTISNNFTLVDFWKPHTKIEFYDEVLLQTKEVLIEQFNSIIELLKQKTNNAIKEQKIDSVIAFEEKIGEEILRFKECNQIISAYIKRIEELKTAPTKTEIVLEEELKTIKLNKVRFSDAAKMLAQKFIDTEHKIRVYNGSKDRKQEELRIYTSSTLSTYKVTINKYLKRFATYMEIKEFKSAYAGSSKVPSVEYKLYVSGNEVEFKDNGISPSFKYVLSEGDKSALAFSFFLATLLEDKANLQNKILVFDDPVSSFDRSRQLATVKILHGLASQAKQLFVLTHNIAFAGEFYYHYPKRSEIQSLQIFDVKNQSHLEEFPIEIETLPDVLKDLHIITEYLRNGAKDDGERKTIMRCLRPILEGYYKMKFFGTIQEKDWLGGFIKKIKESKTGDKVFRLQKFLPDLEQVNDYTSEHHHGSLAQQQIDNGELRTHTEITLKLLEEI